MDKLLAMSILSSTPSEIYGPLMNLSIFGKSDQTKERDAKVQSRSQIEEAKKQGSQMPEKQSEKKLKPRFAVEFDGINCFDTIIFH
jgi:hypothetical protein